MFGLEALDILIGLVTIYLAFAVACTACVEAISAALNFRSTNLRDALGELLNGEVTQGQRFVDAFYDHPLVKTLSKGNGRGPSYIPPAIVGKVVESIIVTKTGVADLEKAVEALPEGRTKDLLKVLSEEAGEGIGDFRRLVETQFDVTMERASGWFKRKTQLVTLCVSAVLVVALNVDTVAIATSLSANPEARAELVKSAGELLREAEQAQSEAIGKEAEDTRAVTQLENQTALARSSLEQAKASLAATELPLGWGAAPASGTDTDTDTDATVYLTKIFGLVLSILAISLGAPFWFNVLDRFNAIRSSGVPQSVGEHMLSQRGAPAGKAESAPKTPAVP